MDSDCSQSCAVDKSPEARRCSGRDSEMLCVQSKIWVERDGKVVLSDWRVRLLETIDETGSLSRAAEKLEVPYRTAWYKLKEIEDRLGVKLLETQSGGADGGGSRLTADARQLITRFRRVCAGIGELVEQRFRTESRDLLG